MPNVIQIRRTLTANNPPPNGSLAVGEFGIELAGPHPRLWCGVPTSLDPTGRRLITDVTRAYVDSQFAAVGSGTLTRLETGPGLHGGPITHTGTIALITPVPIHHGGTGADSLDDAPFLALRGGEMHGPLLLHHTLHEHEREAVSKAYVDAMSMAAGGGITHLTAGTGLRTTGQTNTINAPGGTIELVRPVSISNGGTGVSTLPELREMLGLSPSGGTGVTEITAGTGLLGGIIRTTGTIELHTPIRIVHGGTGAENAEDARRLLGIEQAINEAIRDAGGGVTQIIAGTGLRATGIGVNDNIITATGTIAIDVVPIANGGTGATTQAGAREALGIGTGPSLVGIDGIIVTAATIGLDVPVAIMRGGTDATDADTALANLGGIGDAPGDSLHARRQGSWQPVTLVENPTTAGQFLRTHTGTWVAGVPVPTGNNTRFGLDALIGVTTGASNTAVGAYALERTTTGSDNVAVGGAALGNNATGSNNIAIGVNAQRGTADNTNNIAIGTSALRALTGGGSNVAIGNNAGDSAITISNSIFIGRSAQPQNTTQANQIVIGFEAAGRGSNTVTLGNDAIVGMYCSGSLHLGAPTGPAPTGTGNINISGQYLINGVPFTGGGDGVDPSLFVPVRGGQLSPMTNNAAATGVGLTIHNNRTANANGHLASDPAIRIVNNAPDSLGGIFIDNYGAAGIRINNARGRGVHVVVDERGPAFSAVAHTEDGFGLSLATLAGQPSTGTPRRTLEVSRGVVVGNPFGGDLGVGTINVEDGYFVNGQRIIDDGEYP